MNILFYNSYNLFFPQYLNTESTYQLFCNTALSALLHQSKAYYGGKNVFLWEIIGMGVSLFLLLSDETKVPGTHRTEF